MGGEEAKNQEMLRRTMESNARLLVANQRLEQENKLLRDKLDGIIRRMFGARSEWRPMAGADMDCRRQPAG